MTESKTFRPSYTRVSCVECKFWVHKGDHYGTCQRYPPVEAGERDGWTGRWNWPTVLCYDYCGEFVGHGVEDVKIKFRAFYDSQNG